MYSVYPFYCFTLLSHTADDLPPSFSSCPSDMTVTVDIGGGGSIIVSWSEPRAIDNSGSVTLVSRSHMPGSSFPVGRTTVSYTFEDPSGNQAFCTFAVTVMEGNHSHCFVHLSMTHS